MHRRNCFMVQASIGEKREAAFCGFGRLGYFRPERAGLRAGTIVTAENILKVGQNRVNNSQRCGHKALAGGG